MGRVSGNIKKFINSTEKKLVVFDLDGTLSESKSPIDREMGRLLFKLLYKFPVAVIGGGKYEQFQKQLIKKLGGRKSLVKNLFLFPANSTTFYRYRNGWRKIYEDRLSKSQKNKIIKGLLIAIESSNYGWPTKTYGKIIEDRETQITFSALGQMAPVRLKKIWNKKDIRSGVVKALRKLIPGFEIHSGGLTSIDVTKKGINKAYGLKQIKKHLGISYKNMLFVGDALYPGGNDYAAIKTGADCIQVSGPKETKKIIKILLTG